VGFEQATIPIEKEREFQQLRDAIDRVYTPPLVDKFLRSMKSKRISVRQFDRVLAEGLIEKNYPEVGSANALYEALTMTDQAQLREFYLERIEKVSVELRKKFSSIYRTF
jgi:hypothetical protein